jgi:hypothetical protein
MNILKSDALQGMTFLVTGASSGIGKAAAILLSECGAHVVVNGRDEARLNQTLAELKGAGHLASVASLENADQTTDWLKTVLDQSGPLAGVFHCAGMELIRPARMIKQAGIDFVNLPDSNFDVPFGEATGAAVIFGATGGVMEAAVRTVYEILEGKPMENLEIAPIRGVEGVKEATLTILGKPVKVAVVHGTKNAKFIMDKIKAGEKYDFVEIMACPGGCVNGGGQPIVSAQDRMGIDLRAERAKALYSEDRSSTLRKSHENPAIQELYTEFLEKPCSHKSHKYLHTTYQKRENY